MTFQTKISPAEYELTTTPVFDWNYNARHKIIVNQGGSRSGKTYNILLVLICRLLQERNQVCTVIGQDVPNLKKGPMRDMEAIFDSHPRLARHVAAFNQTSRIYKFRNGSRMEFTSFKDKQDAQSGSRQYAFFNEANGIPWEIFDQVSLRTTKQIFLDYNPTAAFWAHTRLMGRADTIFFYSRYIHNPFAPANSIAHIKEYKESDPESWKVYGLGKTGAIQGLVFDRVSIAEYLPDYFSRRAYGLDFGYVKPCAGSLVQETEGSLYLHELFYRYGMKTRDMADALFENGVGSSDPVYCDSASPLTIAELQDMGVNAIAAHKYPGSVNDGIRFMKGFKKVYITAESTNWRKEQQNYRWRQDPKTGEYLDEPIKAWDHLWDSGRYGCLGEWGVLGRLPEIVG